MNLQTLQQYYGGKTVLLTGHTGFKGSWLLQILHMAGAHVHGLALAPEQPDDLYNTIQGQALCVSSTYADIRNSQMVLDEVQKVQPDIIFHLAAQPLVRRSYNEPSYTFEVNCQGTIHVMEAMRSLDKPCIGIMITTDKVYENFEDGRAYKEEDKLGGYDPYSASKAAAEIAIGSYRNSFFNPKHYGKHHKALAAARAGNVIGGGDFAADRIIPDIVRAIQNDQPVTLRNPGAVRPWQHVLEPLAGYLQLCIRLMEDPVLYAQGYNFGPETNDVLQVEVLTQAIIKVLEKGEYRVETLDHQLHEAQLLMLDIAKAKGMLDWVPKLNALQAIEWTAQWYKAQSQDARAKCTAQIEAYFNL